MYLNFKLLATAIVFSINCNLIAQIEINPPEPKYPPEVSNLLIELQNALERKSTILVPFFENGKFGYLDYKTLEIVVPAIASELSLVNTDSNRTHIGTLSLNGSTYSYVIDEEGLKIMTYGPPQVSEELPPGDWVRSAAINVELVLSDG